MFIGPCIILIAKLRETNLMTLAFLFHYLMLNMFMSMKNSKDTIWDRTSDLRTRITAP